MAGFLERRFRIAANGSTPRTEVAAGVTTFLALAYILFVQPSVLSTTGMDRGAVLTATCIASALGTLVMAFLTNYPIAVAPAMGHNFFFAYAVCAPAAAGGLGYGWATALGAVFLAGAIFVVLSLTGIREAILRAIPTSLQHAIGAGIGLLIAMIGLEWGGLVVASPGTLIKLGDLGSEPALLTLFGLAVAAVLIARGVRGAFLLAILASTGLGLAMGLVEFHGIASAPPSLAPTLLALDPLSVFTAPGFVGVVAVFFFLALFDTVGTLIGVASRAGFVKDGRIPRARGALLADSIGTTVGACLGTSTVTAYIESTAGVSQGGRTGLANVVTAGLLLLSMFFYPLVETVGGGVASTGSSVAVLYPVTAPVLILVGSMMIPSLAKVDWEEPLEAIPAFLTAILMPVTFSITDGIAFGFIATSLLDLARGRLARDRIPLHAIAAAFVLRFVFLRDV